MSVAADANRSAVSDVVQDHFTGEISQAKSFLCSPVAGVVNMNP